MTDHWQLAATLVHRKNGGGDGEKTTPTSRAKGTIVNNNNNNNNNSNNNKSNNKTTMTTSSMNGTTSGSTTVSQPQSTAAVAVVDGVVPDEPFHALLPPLDEKDPNCRRIYLIRHGETDWNAQLKIQGGGFDIPLNANGMRQAQAVADLFVNNDGNDKHNNSTTTTTTRIPVDLVSSSHLQRAHTTADFLWKACRRHHHRQHYQDRTEKCSSPQEQQIEEEASSSTDDDNLPPRRIVNPGLGEMRFGSLEGLSRDKHYVPITDEDRIQHEHLLDLYNTVSHEMRTNLTIPWPGEGGESQVDVQQRSLSAFYDILDHQCHETDRHIVIVSHGRTNRVLLASLLCRLIDDDDKEGTGEEIAAHHHHPPRRTSDQLDPIDFLKKQREIKQGNTCVNVLDVKDTFITTDNGKSRHLQRREIKAQLLNYIDHVKEFVIAK